MLLGLVRPTRGRVLLFGRNLAGDRKEAVRPVGSLVETATCYPTLTVRENLEIQRRLTRADRGAVQRAIGLLGLEPVAGRQAGRLSLGNSGAWLARRHPADPRLLIHEPANALDPAGIVESAPAAAWPTSRGSRYSFPATSWPRSPNWPTASASSTTGGSSRKSTPACPGPVRRTAWRCA
jgi:hypothetical protein